MCRLLRRGQLQTARLLCMVEKMLQGGAGDNRQTGIPGLYNADQRTCGKASSRLRGSITQVLHGGKAPPGLGGGVKEAGRSREVGDQGMWSAVDPSPQQTALAPDTKMLTMPAGADRRGCEFVDGLLVLRTSHSKFLSEASRSARCVHSSLLHRRRTSLLK